MLAGAALPSRVSRAWPQAVIVTLSRWGCNGAQLAIGLCLPGRRCPGLENLLGVGIHRKEALDAQLLEGDVLRRAERCDRREEFEREFPLFEVHCQDRRVGCWR